MSASSSRLLTGNDPIYEELEAIMAADYGRPVLLFNSGYHANLGILPALSDARTLVLADKLVHASMVDGIRLCSAEVHRFRHNDLNHLDTLLRKYAQGYERIILMTESIFSMDGDLAPLEEYVALKDRYPNLLLYVDEAHALGVRGERGLGLGEELRLLPQIDLLVGTFGKALASMGAFVVCSEEIRKVLVNRMRPLIFSTHFPPFQAAWTKYVWEHMRSMHGERIFLRGIGERLRSTLAHLQGSDSVSDSHIVPYIVGESKAALQKAEELRACGFFALAVRPPTVPQGSSRIRFSLTADMSEQEVQALSDTLIRIW